MILWYSTKTKSIDTYFYFMVDILHAITIAEKLFCNRSVRIDINFVWPFKVSATYIIIISLNGLCDHTIVCNVSYIPLLSCGVHGRVFHLESRVLYRQCFESRQWFWIILCMETIQLAYGSSMDLLCQSAIVEGWTWYLFIRESFQASKNVAPSAFVTELCSSNKESIKAETPTHMSIDKNSVYKYTFRINIPCAW